MMRRIPMMAVVLATVLPATAAAQFQMSPEEEATVRIYTIASVSLLSDYDATGQPLVLAVPEIGHGSGIALSSDGLILTAKHVVEGASALSVKLPRQSQAMPAVIVWEHPTMDYAFIKVRGNFRYYVELPPMGEGPTLRTRDDIFAIGYPLDASRSTPSTTEGIVSRMSDDGMLQLSVSLNPGNSGGPVFIEDSDGQPQLVGIVIAKPVEGEGIAWILPIEPISEGYEQDVIPGDYVAKAVEELQGNPERTRLLDKLSVFVAEMVEAYSDPDNPHVFGNMDDAMMLAGLADAGLPEASLLCAGILFNQAMLNGNADALTYATQIVDDLYVSSPDVYNGSAFAQELYAYVHYGQYSTTSTGGQTGPYCDYGTPCTNPGDYCDANQCLPIQCYSDNDCPYDSICLSDGYCSGVPCGGNYGSTIVCPENFACTYGFCREGAPPPPSTGCQCGVVGGGARGAWAAPALLGLLALRFVRRRRRA